MWLSVLHFPFACEMQRAISVVPKSVNAERMNETIESVNVRLSVAGFDSVSRLERNYRNSVVVVGLMGVILQKVFGMNS